MRIIGSLLVHVSVHDWRAILLQKIRLTHPDLVQTWMICIQEHARVLHGLKLSKAFIEELVDGNGGNLWNSIRSRFRDIDGL